MNKRVIEDISDFIFMSDMPQKSDIIFIPGTSKSAITEKAAQLYHEGYAQYVLPSGRFSSNIGKFASENIDNPLYYGEYDTDFDYCRHILIKNNVPKQAILCENQAENSMENAAFSAKLLQQKGFKLNKAILCCQAFHARRAFMSYALHFPDTEIFVVPTNTQNITKENWYKEKSSFNKIMKEVSKCGNYFLNSFV